MRRQEMRPLILLLISLLAGVCSCGNGGVTPDPGPLTDGKFSLSVITDSQLGAPEGGQFGIKSSIQGDATVIEVSAASARGLQALYFELSFDPESYNPISAAATEALGSRSQVLEVYTVPERGKLYHGQILANAGTKPGFSGSGILARVVFKNEPQPQASQTSAAASRLTDKVPLTWDANAQSLNWRYANLGDYNQDGVVGVTDLTPLALKFGQAAGAAQFPADSLESQVDGDLSGTLDASDIKLIVDNWGRSVQSGYNVYASLHCEDYPVYDQAPSTVAPVANVPLAATLTSPADARLKFGYQVSNPMEGVLYWVRPVSDDGEEGISSDLLLGNPAAPGLWVANPPAISPKAPYVVEHGDTYTLIVDDPTDGDVSTAAGTAFTVEPAQAATVAGNTLTVASGYQGWFSVHATYNGEVVKPGSRDTSQTADNGGLGFYVPEPDSVFALPAATEVHAGGRVGVTVYSYESAHPLVHPVVTIEPGSNARYVPYSLNIGIPGNDPYYPDGLWAEVGASEYAELPDNWIEDIGPFYQYRLFISVAAHNGTPVSNGTGALFNFELQLMGDSTLALVESDYLARTWYSDGTPSGNSEVNYFWAHCDNAGVPTITTYGEPPQLSLRLDNPPADGAGTKANPYQIEPDADYTLTLLSDVFGDITTNASTAYTVMPDTAGKVKIVDSDAMLELKSGYSGSIQIRAEYGGISTDDSNSLFLFLSGGSLDVYRNGFYVQEQTYMYGGTADDITQESSNYWDTNDEGFQEEFLKMDIVAHGASHLKALYVDIELKPELLTFSHVGDTSAMDIGDGLLVMPDQFYRDYSYNNGGGDPTYTFEYCQVMINPQNADGFSGDGNLVSLLFHKAPKPVTEFRFKLPTGEENRSPATFDRASGILSWYHYNVGDYNQDFCVTLEDIIPLAVHFGETVTGGPNSIQAVIDGDHDGHIYLGDLQPIIDHTWSLNGVYYIFGGPQAVYPDNGLQIAEFRPEPSDQIGNPETERVRYEYTVETPQDGMGYWATPYIHFEYGTPSDFASGE